MVFYIPKNVTVTCYGSNGSGTTPGYPGILVPSDATFIVTGESELIAKGGNAGAGANDGNGEDGHIFSDPVYVKPGTTGWGSTWHGCPVQTW